MRPFKQHLTKQQIEELKYEFHYCNHSIEELAEKYQIHKDTVRYHVFAHIKERKDAYSKALYESRKDSKEFKDRQKKYYREHKEYVFRQYKGYRDPYYQDHREHYKKIFHMNYLKRSGASCDTCIYRDFCVKFMTGGLCDKFKKERKRKCL